MSNQPIQIRLQQRQNYQFDIHFGPDIPVLIGDEPAPLGEGRGPSPEHLLLAAVGNCLADSLLFALRKFQQAPEPIQCDVSAQLGRNPQGRMRVQRIDVTLTLGVPAAALAHLDRVLAQFEDFCTVTGSVRAGIEVVVGVMDATGQKLK